jgi:hypothetical protein
MSNSLDRLPADCRWNNQFRVPAGILDDSSGSRVKGEVPASVWANAVAVDPIMTARTNSDFFLII